MPMGPPDEPGQELAPPEPHANIRGWASRTFAPPAAESVEEPFGVPSAREQAEPNATASRSLSLTGWLVLGTVAIVLTVMTFALPLWTEARSSSRVVLLGCGSSLSVLIQSGDARVVIAAGDDPAAFGRAFGSAIALAGDRIDLLVVGATGKDLAVPADLARGDTVRQIVRLGAPHPGRETGDLPADLPQVPPLARIDVAPGLTVTIETVEIPNPGADQPGDFNLAWRAEIRSGEASVTVLSDAEHAGAFTPLTSRGVLVAASDDELGALLPAPAGALVVNADDVDGSEIREGLPPLLSADLPTIRVHPGAAVTLRLTNAGVELPPDDVVIIHPAAAREG